MKKLIILWFMCLPSWICAQEVKVAIVNQSEVFNAMPELSAVETQLAQLNEKYEKELKIMTDEHQKKYADYVAQQDSLTENIKLRRQQDIQDLATRIENYIPIAKQEMEKTAQELYAPIQEKVLNAIKSVGDEKGFTVILPSQTLLYIGASAIDATPFVKAKLGLK